MNIAIFGSGNGTNAQRIIEYFSGSPDIHVACVVYNRRDAFIAQRAAKLGVETRYISKKVFEEGSEVLDYMKACRVDYIVLAGFLLLVPEPILEAFPGRVVNIHPALLPKYGGKGMYGEHVHEAVIANKEKESGITIHVVDQHYDCGTTLFQAKCSVNPGDTPESLAMKIHQLEQEHFPRVIEEWIRSNETNS